MWEDDLLPILGFKNVTRDNTIIGFQLNLRPNDAKQTGEYACSIQAIDLTVDGENIATDRMTVTIGGRTFAFNDLENAGNIRRAPDEVYTVTVNKPGGLTPGLHHVQASVRMRAGGTPNEPLWGAGGRGGAGGANAPGGAGAAANAGRGGGRGGGAGAGGGGVTRNMTLVE